jgi:two-component system, cell cycle sensor histidine kinase and response regulator CckA
LQERAVLESEEKYRMLVENSLQGLAIIQDQRIVFCNRRFAEMSGYSIDDLLAFSSNDNASLVHPDDRALLSEYTCNVMERKPVPPNLEYRVLKRDGTVAWLEAFSSVIEYNGKPAIQSAFVDITKRKEAENALQQSEKRFKLIADSIDEIFWIWDCEKRMPTYVNPAFERICGRSHDYFLDTQKSVLDQVHPDDLPRVMAVLERMKDGRKLDIEHRIIRADGSVRNIWTRCFPAADETGAAKNYVGIAQDVTEWRRAEEGLRKSKEHLDSIINCLGDAVFVKDQQLQFVLVNAAFCKFSGRPAEELLGKTADQMLPKEVAIPLRNEEQDILDTGRESTSQESIPKEEGNTRYVMTKKTRFMDKNGNKHIVGVMRDITEYKRLETQFLEAQKMEAIRVLAGGVAHDFNNLLSVIKGYTELLMEEFEPGDQRRADLDQIENAGQRAASLISQLLAFSRKQILQPESLDLNAIVNDMTKMLRRLIGADVDLVAIAQPDLKSIYADPAQIQQIIMNLAVNAHDAMPYGGKLTIETANVNLDESHISRRPDMKPGGYVMLAISDSGVGMDIATQSRIFEPFFTTKERGKGTGLGLSTIYGIVKQSNGFICVHSEPGKGATFNIYFPPMNKEDFRTSSKGVAEYKREGTETVLIAEDEEAVRALAGRILSGRGYKVLDAANGKEALRISREYPDKIYLVLTDIIMPEMGGSELVAKLKESRPGIKALYFSGYTGDAIARHGVLDPGVDFLQKPFTIESLLHKVREVISK